MASDIKHEKNLQTKIASQNLRPQAQKIFIRFLVRLRRAKKHFSAGGVCERSECMERPPPLSSNALRVFEE